ncbi:hypothetical protein EON64_10085 [archaeon]|nr:MAG: hypothetical protein EON64_10085 [archaeon]
MEAYGESSVETAHAYYEYGNALLIKEEDSRNLLSNVEGEDGDETKEADVEAAAEDGEGGEGEEEVGDDAQIAWEVLEAARLVLDKLPDADSNAILAEVSMLPCTLFVQMVGGVCVGMVFVGTVCMGVWTKHHILYVCVCLQIYLRLGDLKQLNGLFLEAVPEYLASLRIKKKICSADDR